MEGTGQARAYGFRRATDGIAIAFLIKSLPSMPIKVLQERNQLMKNSPIRPWSRDSDLDFFDTVSEEEIIGLWRSIKGKGLSEDDAWQAVVTGIALDMAFSKTKASFEIEH
jgi:hypothetical protein